MLYVHWMCIVYFTVTKTTAVMRPDLKSHLSVLAHSGTSLCALFFVILFEVTLCFIVCMYLLTRALPCSFLVKRCLRSSVLLSLCSACSGDVQVYCSLVLYPTFLSEWRITARRQTGKTEKWNFGKHFHVFEIELFLAALHSLWSYLKIFRSPDWSLNKSSAY